MRTTTCTRVGLGALILGFALGLSSCATGYITTSVQSVIGLDVSENPKTQVPHIRFGFVRSQYYYIPTGKSPSAQGAPSSGKADETPTMVSSMDVEMEFLKKANIREKFAVGAAAVETPASLALFGVQNIVVAGGPLHDLRMKIRPLIRKDPDKAKRCINQIAPQDPNRDNPERFVNSPPKPEEKVLQQLLDCLEKP